MAYPWFNFAVALGLGLLIGLKRERSKGEGPTRGPAGIRTFALASLLGAIAIYLGQIPLLMVMVGGVALLTATSYLRGRADDPGLTTEVALLAAPLLGGIAMSDPLLASGLGVAVVTQRRYERCHDIGGRRRRRRADGVTLTLRALKAKSPDHSQSGRAFSGEAAFTLAGTMSVMLVVAAGLKDWLGEAGITLGAAIAGVIDAHSTAISVAALAASRKIAPQEAVAPILAAMTTNAAAKCVMAVTAGSRAFAIRIVLRVALSMMAAWSPRHSRSFVDTQGPRPGDWARILERARIDKHQCAC